MKTKTLNNDSYGESKLKYESLEEELARFKEERFDPVKIFIKRNSTKQNLLFYRTLFILAAISSIGLIFLLIISLK